MSNEKNQARRTVRKIRFGAAIRFRVPLELEAKVAELAADRFETPSEFARKIFAQHVKDQLAAKAS